MSERNFNMRMQCTYAGDENAVSGLEVEHLVDGQWQPLGLGETSPGFDVFVYAIFTCQHLYFRVNCAERGLLLDSAEGSIAVGAGEDWTLESLEARFSGRLGSGRAGQDDIDYIVSRMQQCPVSRDIRTPAASAARITLV